jgi:hypothetical protein
VGLCRVGLACLKGAAWQSGDHTCLWIGSLATLMSAAQQALFRPVRARGAWPGEAEIMQ